MLLRSGDSVIAGLNTPTHQDELLNEVWGFESYLTTRSSVMFLSLGSRRKRRAWGASPRSVVKQDEARETGGSSFFVSLSLASRAFI